MRFQSLALVLSALTASTTVVSGGSLHQYQQRSLIDTCANVNAEIEVLGLVFGRLELCLCVSAIPSLLSINPQLQAAVLLSGKSPVVTALTGMINSAADRKQCLYPEHAVPHCDSNPCNFTCTDGFTVDLPSNPSSCVCDPPHAPCNGVCGNFPYCSSQKAKRTSKWRDATCPHGWRMCGIWGGSIFDYECVDVTKDLWSCGGCEIPLVPGDATGIDCTSIPGVLDVSCWAGRCVVDACEDGFQVSADKSTCVPMPCIGPDAPVFVDNGASPIKA